ncbi:MAG: helix-turn-helix domain-containing protein [Chloroflexota bacterium]
MSHRLRTSFASLCRDTRTSLDITQRQLAAATGVSHGHIAAIETGRVNPSLDLVERIGEVLGLRLQLIGRPPVIVEPLRQRDLVHARCSGYVGRRYGSSGWETRRELEVASGRWHGWVDLLAFDPRTRTLVIVEVKTRIDDLGAIERQIAWYEREAPGLARNLGWRVDRIFTWLLLLASDEVDKGIRENRDALADGFPMRAPAMRGLLHGEAAATGDRDPRSRHGAIIATRGLALIDPRSRRRDWLIASRVDGRRSPAPYRDYADAARRLYR